MSSPWLTRQEAIAVLMLEYEFSERNANEYLQWGGWPVGEEGLFYTLTQLRLEAENPF